MNTTVDVGAYRLTLIDAGPVHLRETAEDGVHRRAVLTPGGDLAGLPQAVVETCRGHWTPERVAAWRASRPEQAEMTLEDAKARRLAAIRAEAGRRIAEVAPDYRQRNVLARSVELLEAAVLRGGFAGLTADEQVAAAAARVLWARINPIRLHSDVLEALAAAAPSMTALAAIDITVGWPETGQAA
ncbi:MAG: hypothetical protein H6843_00190 [Rhodospirillaceae bacterium]|nr:hypothetical protein [Rhodospirillaceae bacterium]